MTVVKAYYKHEHGDQPQRLETAADVDQLIDGLLTEDYSNSVAALYVEGRLNAAGVPDHELLVAINNQDGDVGALRYMGGAGTYYTKGVSHADTDPTYYYTGSGREFPADSELPIQQIRRAVQEFVAGGQRPGSVAWQVATD
ncbi:Imm1 family immunity protein [Kribbella sp. NPDC026611]|uniref:Imm1 family immunity protein n=1 Tax=Kribbella sp. NPDC026611 TaxID=3154911 RepID=UPI0033D7FFC7